LRQNAINLEISIRRRYRENLRRKAGSKKTDILEIIKNTSAKGLHELVYKAASSSLFSKERIDSILCSILSLKNSMKSPHAWRYTSKEKELYSVISSMSPLCYSFFAANNTVPSLSTLQKLKKNVMYKYDIGINEENFEKAKSFFQSCEYEQFVGAEWKMFPLELAMDATYLRETLEVREVNGHFELIGASYDCERLVTSEDHLKKILETCKPSNSVTLLVLHPLIFKVPSYIVGILPTCKYDKMDVLNWIKDCLIFCYSHELPVISVSRDGENR